MYADSGYESTVVLWDGTPDDGFDVCLVFLNFTILRAGRVNPLQIHLNPEWPSSLHVIKQFVQCQIRLT